MGGEWGENNAHSIIVSDIWHYMGTEFQIHKNKIHTNNVQIKTCQNTLMLLLIGGRGL